MGVGSGVGVGTTKGTPVGGGVLVGRRGGRVGRGAVSGLKQKLMWLIPAGLPLGLIGVDRLMSAATGEG